MKSPFLVILFTILTSLARPVLGEQYRLGKAFAAIRPPSTVHVMFGFGNRGKPPGGIKKRFVISQVAVKDLNGRAIDFITLEKVNITTGPAITLTLRVRKPSFRDGFYIEGRMQVNGNWYRVNGCVLPDPKGEGWIVTPPITLGCLWRVKREEDY